MPSSGRRVDRCWVFSTRPVRVRSLHGAAPGAAFHPPKSPGDTVRDPRVLSGGVFSAALAIVYRDSRVEELDRGRVALLGAAAASVMPLGLGAISIVGGSQGVTVLTQAGPGRSSAILFRQGVAEDPNAVQVACIHLREVTVSVGDTVQAGQHVARVGNNGSSFNPHLHIGAFRGALYSDDAVPLQVHMDLAAMGRLHGLVR